MLAYWCDDNWNDGWDYAELADEIFLDSQSGDPQEQQIIETYNI